MNLLFILKKRKINKKAISQIVSGKLEKTFFFHFGTSSKKQGLSQNKINQ
ncbi:MAG: hypothetical protein MRERV_9c001 [Mycoplasmataceae bacterium RV_VA103A]|nr:MAG: hypothetical protein MRERV_9c001 [Mycoplasmataceae bacterium RV_VA103A]